MLCFAVVVLVVARLNFALLFAFCVLSYFRLKFVAHLLSRTHTNTHIRTRIQANSCQQRVPSCAAAAVVVVLGVALFLIFA